MESIARNIRRGIPWVVVPLAIATAIRLSLEPAYLTWRLGLFIALVAAFGIAQVLLLRHPNAWRIRGSVFTGFLAINLGYMSIGWALGAYHGWRADDLVYSVDR